jgi:chaperone modulatory protein CbpM
MKVDNGKTVVSELVEERNTVSLGQLCRSCGVHAEWVAHLVEHGVIEPEAGSTTTQWQFRTTHLRRVHAAAHLQRDLDLNVAGVALALDLMDEIEALHRRLRAFGEE